MPLPADSHVHSEWSWDAVAGSMERTCARAVAIGLPVLAFTEHLDHTVWTVTSEDLLGSELLLPMLDDEGHLRPPTFDAEGYLAAVDRCRARFPELRILSGLELGEPHWHADAVRAVLNVGRFDRLLGSLHCLPHADGFAEPPAHFRRRRADDVVRAYLAEVVELVRSSGPFEVLAHIDYPLRSWPRETAGPVDPGTFEEEFRHALRATADSGRALEINTALPLDARVLRWWGEEGGVAVSFGSDAHDPGGLARGFREAAALADSCGFRPGAAPYEMWGRQ